MRSKFAIWFECYTIDCLPQHFTGFKNGDKQSNMLFKRFNHG
jgi:hypothetical protein